MVMVISSSLKMARNLTRGEMKKAFTLIEMMVSVAIVAMLSIVAVVSLAPAQQSASAKTGADEVKTLLEELRSYSVGPAQERAANYILIIHLPSNPPPGMLPYCNAGLTGNPNRLKNNALEYMICYTNKKDISTANLNSDFSRVRGGHFEAQITLSDLSGYAKSGNDLIFNARTYDHMLGYNKKYFDSGATTNEDIQISDTQTPPQFTKKITIDPILSLITLQ